jgi:hypothetical protein
MSRVLYLSLLLICLLVLFRLVVYIRSFVVVYFVGKFCMNEKRVLYLGVSFQSHYPSTKSCAKLSFYHRLLVLFDVRDCCFSLSFHLFVLFRLTTQKEDPSSVLSCSD